ncbi:unnamed protein product, partial [Amoebophrya sp. A25]
RFVRVRTNIHPIRGWGMVTPDDVGLCVLLKARLAFCVFAEQQTWRAFVDELEVVEVPQLIFLRDRTRPSIRRGATAGVISCTPQPQAEKDPALGAEKPRFEMQVMVFQTEENQDGNVMNVTDLDEGTLWARVVKPRRSSIVYDPLELATR